MVPPERDGEWSCWPAPAKLNLFLRIVGRRADGYHLLQTYFQLLDWGDEVRLRVRADGRIERAEATAGVNVDADISLRAAHLLKQTTGMALGADIAVEKRIPIGAGLGGGSSDAATVLVALNALWKTGLDDERLAVLGVKLGADVPVFVRGLSAWAEGVGELLEPLPLPDRWFLIVDPCVAVSTTVLFRDPDLTRNAPRTTIPRFVSGDVTDNAFEPVVRARHPQVARALDWLGQYGNARLSGSGGCIFLPIDARADGEALLDACPKGMRAWLAQGVTRSPLRDALVAVSGER